MFNNILNDPRFIKSLANTTTLKAIKQEKSLKTITELLSRINLSIDVNDLKTPAQIHSMLSRVYSKCMIKDKLYEYHKFLSQILYVDFVIPRDECMPIVMQQIGFTVSRTGYWKKYRKFILRFLKHVRFDSPLIYKTLTNEDILSRPEYWDKFNWKFIQPDLRVEK